MAKPITSAPAYKSARKLYKDPVTFLHFLYNLHCDPQYKMSIKQFQGMLSVWLLKTHKARLLQGSLMIVKFFDAKFA